MNKQAHNMICFYTSALHTISHKTNIIKLTVTFVTKFMYKAVEIHIYIYIHDKVNLT